MKHICVGLLPWPSLHKFYLNELVTPFDVNILDTWCVSSSPCLSLSISSSSFVIAHFAFALAHSSIHLYSFRSNQIEFQSVKPRKLLSFGSIFIVSLDSLPSSRFAFLPFLSGSHIRTPVRTDSVLSFSLHSLCVWLCVFCHTSIRNKVGAAQYEYIFIPTKFVGITEELFRVQCKSH